LSKKTHIFEKIIGFEILLKMMNVCLKKFITKIFIIEEDYLKIYLRKLNNFVRVLV